MKKNHCSIKGNDPRDFAPDFLDRITDACDENAEVVVLSTGMAVSKNDRKIDVLGCHFCLGKPISQDKYGYPQIDNRNLLPFDKVETFDVFGLTNVVKNSLWFCPNCRIPIKKLILKDVTLCQHTK